MKNKIALISLGCAKNLVDSEQMLYLLDKADFELVAAPENADVAVVNTCAFIESAKTEAIETILSLAELKNDGRLKKIVAAGCLTERYKDEIMNELPELDAVVGVASVAAIADAVRSVLSGQTYRAFGDTSAPVDETPRVIATPQSWAYLKVAEGCDNRCAYCVIPDIRGPFRSRPMENIVREAETLVENGARELIVVAQDTTRYGLDLYGERRLPELLDALCGIDGLKWLRLHYLYPDEITDRLIETIARQDKILNYLDIPIQHISDAVLTKMGRRGTGDEIRALFKKLRERLNGLVLRTSLITGLPGEGDAEFDELSAFLQDAKIERAGVFPYSPEEGTPAEQMPRADAETAERRADILRAVQNDIMDDYNARRIGTVIEVLAEGVEDGYAVGRSYAESPDVDGWIYLDGGDVSIGEFYTVRITGTINDQPLGVIESDK